MALVLSWLFVLIVCVMPAYSTEQALKKSKAKALQDLDKNLSEQEAAVRKNGRTGHSFVAEFMRMQYSVK